MRAGAAICRFMPRAMGNPDSLRFSRLEIRRLTAALLLSLLAHLGVWASYEAGVKFGWWQKLHLPVLRHPAANKIIPRPPATPQEMEPPMTFVDVSHADADAPKSAKYYSDKNSRAANPDADTDANQPKLKGRQKNIPKTEDAPKLNKLQPTPPPQPATETQPAEETQPSSTMNLGDLKPAKATNTNAPGPQTKTPTAPKRPRTLNEARAQQSPQLPGVTMQQDGGVKRQDHRAALDVKATAFGDYDRKIIEAVTQRWYDLLDSRHFAQDRTGKVSLHFKLKYDGTVEEMKTLENSVGEMLGYVCSESVQQAAPFEKWPADMRRMIGANFRDITFTFYYY